MRIQLVLAAVVVCIVALYCFDSNPKIEARKVIKEFVTYLKRGDRQGARSLMRIVVPVDDGESFYALDCNWLELLCQHGQWNSARLAVGKIETKRLAETFRCKERNLWILSDTVGYVAFCKNETGQWQILGCYFRACGEYVICENGRVQSTVGKSPAQKDTQNIPDAKTEDDDKLQANDTKEKTSLENSQKEKKNVQKPESEDKEQETEKPLKEKAPPEESAKEPEKHKLFLGVSYQVMPEEFGVEQRLLKNLDSGKNYEIKDEIDLPPGKYLLELKREGYSPYRKEFEILPGPPYMHFFQCNFKPLPRKFRVVLRGDYPPGETLLPDRVFLNGDLLEENELVMPGSYELKIVKDGYTSVEDILTVGAGSQDYVVSKNLCVLERMVMLEILDRESRKTIIPDRMLIGGAPIDNRLTLKPGRYDFQVFARGYQSLQQQIEVPIGSSLFRVSLFLDKSPIALQAKGRTLLFKMYSSKGEQVEPLSILVNGKPFIGQRYPVGSSLKIEARFKEYRTHFSEFTLYPGDKPVVIQAELTYLPELIFFVPEAEIILDSILYRWKFSVEGRPIESHLAKVRESDSEAEVTLRVPPTTERIQVYRAYFYAEYDLADLPTVVEDFNSISLPLWQRHFKKLKKLKGPSLAFQYMEHFFEGAENVKKLKNSAKAGELDKLISYLKDWPVPEEWQKEIEKKLSIRDK